MPERFYKKNFSLKKSGRAFIKTNRAAIAGRAYNARNACTAFLSCLFMIILAAPLSSEVFRTHRTVVLDMNSNPGEKKCGINDSVAVILPVDMTFVQGIEITVKIPQAVANYRNTITYSLYKEIRPFPSEKSIDYSGTELYSGLYPGQLIWTILVPLKKNNTIKQSPYADKSLIPDAEKGFVFLRNQLAMKGVPASVMQAEFDVSASVILAELGALKITAPAASENYSVVVDEKAESPNGAGLYLLKPGKHTVSISSEEFRNELRTVLIQRAEITELSVALTSVQPAISVQAPEGTRVFVDGAEVKDINSLDLESGEHIFKFVLGGYEVSKNVSIQKGKSYNISVNMDATIKEE